MRPDGVIPMPRKLSWILGSKRSRGGKLRRADATRLMESVAGALAEVAAATSPTEDRLARIGAKLTGAFAQAAPGFLALVVRAGRSWRTKVICQPEKRSLSAPGNPPESELPQQLFAVSPEQFINIRSTMRELPGEWSRWAVANGADGICFFPVPFKDRGLWVLAGSAYRGAEWTSLLNLTARLVVTATLGEQTDRDEVLEKEFARWLQVREPQLLCEMFSGQLADEFGFDRSLFSRQSKDKEQPESLYARGVGAAAASAILPKIHPPVWPDRRPGARLQVLPRPDDASAGSVGSLEQFSYLLSVSADSGVRVTGIIGGEGKRRLAPEEEHRLERWLRRFELALDNQQRLARLEALSYTDTLTGIFNRRFFKRRLGEEITRARRFGRSLSLVVFDLDRFKSLNDTYGHLAGDQVLREVAELLTVTVRSIDIACRYGGDEFVIVMPETGLSDCFSFTDRLRGVIFEHTFRPGRRREAIQLSVSLGVTVFPEHADGAERLFWCADMALLKAKEAGGNRSLIYQPGMDSSSRPNVR